MGEAAEKMIERKIDMPEDEKKKDQNCEIVEGKEKYGGGRNH